MEGEQGAQYSETQEDKREEDALHFVRNMQFGYLQQVHGFAACTIEDAEDTDQQEGGTSHQHQGQLHGCVFFTSATPYADQQVHRDQGYFIEHEHGE